MGDGMHSSLGSSFFWLAALVLLVLVLCTEGTTSFRLRARPPTGPSGATVAPP